MFKLKLKKALSYNGAVFATKANPFVEVDSEEKANNLVSTGYFDIVTVTEEKEADIDAMTVDQLKAYAAEKSIDLTGCNKKAEILAKIKETAEDDDTADFGEDE